MDDSRKQSGRRFGLPFKKELQGAISHLSFTEWLIFIALAAVMAASAALLVFRLNDYLLVEVPAKGGAITEGVVGSPRFINPLLALSDADRDLTALVYSGLLKAKPDGTLVPDLAASYTISEDGRVYDFLIREDAVFHDGTPVTAEDVEYTVLKAQDPVIKSPKRANWDSVSVERISEREIRFVLKQPYAPFLQNATLGILPKHVWKDVTAEQFPLSYFNFEPIGSGPFSIDGIVRDSAGIPHRYNLSSFNRYALGEPYINRITILFYPNEQSLLSALARGDIESVSGITSSEVGKVDLVAASLLSSPLSRIFAVFFNQNQNTVFAEAAVRKALDQSIDKHALVTEVLSGYGVEGSGPVPAGFLGEAIPAPDSRSQEERFAEAASTLEKAGWSRGEDGVYVKKDKKGKETARLAFSISTSDTPELKKAAEMVRDQWQALGADVELKVFEAGDLSQNIIRPRKYDALLFGEIIGRDLDLFAFWHSSQRNDPGLNVALYTNVKADKLLSDARSESDREARLEQYRQFEAEIAKDAPAVFLYSPSFIYIVPARLKGVVLGALTVPSDRFENVEQWYISTEKIWKPFMSERAKAQQTEE